jgi:hypothetical protein
VVIAATSFLPLVHSLSEAEGVPSLGVAEYPGTIAIDSEAIIKENLEKMTFGEIIEGLTKPVEGSAYGPNAAGSRKQTEIKGTQEEIDEFFRTQKWTDGLAIIPPTMEKVARFLKYTDRSPDEEIAILQPGNLRASPLRIAANAVMAGCRPEDMPILITAVEAMADPYYDLEQIGTTAGLNPFLLINGPIARQLGFEHGVGLVSRGSNPSVGRALGLIIRNIAGFRPGEHYMGTFGYIMPFVLAEDEEGSPWEPFHAEHGFDRNASTVTAGGTHNWGFQAFPSGTDPEGLLKIICKEIVKHINLSVACVMGKYAMMTVLINPSVAQAIARRGYSKQDVEQYLFENSRVNIREISFESKYGNCSGTSQTIRSLQEANWETPKEWADLEGQDVMVPAMPYPGMIHVVVCGDPTRNKAMTLYGAYNRPTIKEIRLPRNWDKMIRELGYPSIKNFKK